MPALSTPAEATLADGQLRSWQSGARFAHHPLEVPGPGLPGRLTAWSPDGRSIVLEESDPTSTTSDLVVLAADGTNERASYLRACARRAFPAGPGWLDPVHSVREERHPARRGAPGRNRIPDTGSHHLSGRGDGRDVARRFDDRPDGGLLRAPGDATADHPGWRMVSSCGSRTRSPPLKHEAHLVPGGLLPEPRLQPGAGMVPGWEQGRDRGHLETDRRSRRRVRTSDS